MLKALRSVASQRVREFSADFKRGQALSLSFSLSAEVEQHGDYLPTPPLMPVTLQSDLKAQAHRKN